MFVLFSCASALLIIHSFELYQPYIHPTVSPGPPLFPLNPRECGSLDLAPFLPISCLTAIWRRSFRYRPSVLCLSVDLGDSLGFWPPFYPDFASPLHCLHLPCLFRFLAFICFLFFLEKLNLTKQWLDFNKLHHMDLTFNKRQPSEREFFLAVHTAIRGQ